ncbi:MAG: GTPase, partial [Steroidobacteraceae bacterium]
TAVPGTTRDVLRERIQIDGMPLHVLDTAGLRTGGDVIEEEGIRRARAEMMRADRLLFVVDMAADPTAAGYREERSRLPPDVPVTLVLNKCDLLAAAPNTTAESDPPRVVLSARSGEGLDALRRHLLACMGLHTPDSGVISARRRHLEALDRARAYVGRAAAELAARRAGELVAEELRQAQRALGEITGEVTSDDLLGRIFASFCIGK